MKMAFKKGVSGVLRRCEKNPRYFADSTGKPIYLTGSHTWSAYQEGLGPDPEKKFDYNAFLDWMVAHGYNFLRGWIQEQASYDNFNVERVYIDPLPFVRSGPGVALDGEPKFDLDNFNQAFFDRIRSRVIAAGERGIYASIMLFNRWSINEHTIPGALPWNGHPFNKDNNINGVDGDPENLGGRAIHTMKIPAALKYQEKYVKKMIDTVNDLENVLYEIGNEHHADSGDWQRHMVKVIKEYEKTKPLQHPVGITSGGGGPDALPNKELLESDADWISPRNEKDAPYMENPVAADGSKVILIDTDHIWGMGGSPEWIWKCFTMGLNPILMDPYEPIYGLENYVVDAWTAVNNRNHPMWEPIRITMGYARSCAERIDLESAIPRPDLASSGYCLADYGREYVVFVPDQKEITVDLGAEACKYTVEWMDIYSGEKQSGSISLSAGTQGKRAFFNPFSKAAALYLKRV